MELCGISGHPKKHGPMKTTKGSRIVLARLLKKVVAEAEAVGELRHRRTLIEEEIKQVDTVLKDRPASLRRGASRTAEPAARSVHREYQQSVREHRKNLERKRFLLQEESEQIGRLFSEMEMQLAETIDLLKKSL